MKLLGFEITRIAPLKKRAGPIGGIWSPVVRDWFPGAWQQNAPPAAVDSVLSHPVVFACVTLIAQDMGKMRPKLVEQIDGIWRETDSPAFSPLLRRPNNFQNHIQFKEWWTTSRLVRGNTYALKERDQRGVVVSLTLLDPARVKPLITPTGLVFYECLKDNLAGVEQETIVVPASEMIHDRMNCLFHPLMGISPIYACGTASQQGLAIQNNSTDFFTNMSRPSGILTAPGPISDEDAREVGRQWQENYSGVNAGRVAVLGDDLKYQPLSITPEAAQVTEQDEMAGLAICRAFHVPPFKVGLGPLPATASLEVMNGIYYADCLQSHIEGWEAAMDEGLGLSQGKIDGRMLGTELDLDALLRMDQKSMIDMLAVGVGSAIYSPDEARRRVDMQSVKGGASPYLQQQNFSLEALAERDQNQPFAKPTTPAPAAPAAPAQPDPDEEARSLAPLLERLAALERRDPEAELADYLARELNHA